MDRSVELKQRLRGTEKQVSEYETRKRQLNKIIKRIETGFSDDIRRINSLREKATGSGIRSIKGIKISDFHNNLVECWQFSVHSDKYLKEVISELNKEYVRCQQKITELNSDISAIQSDIDTIEAEEEKAAAQSGKIGGR